MRLMQPLRIKSATLRPFVVNLKSIPMVESLKPVEIERVSDDPYWHDLCCPSCGEIFLHHGAVRVFSRGQDEETGLETVVSDRESHTFVSSCCDNPSLRRHGLVIDFHCEHCSQGRSMDHVVGQLCISQHKGHTGIFWRAVSEEDNS